MKAAVIIITYNNEQHITYTIESVKAQKFKDWICIIVDNGSTDNTPDLIKKLAGLDDQFFIYCKENEGPSIGRNLGYKNLSRNVQYIHFLDGDDVLHPDFLNVMISYLDIHPTVGLLGCQYDEIDAHGRFISEGRRSRYASGFLGFPKKIADSNYQTPFETFFSATGQGPFAVFRKCVFDKTTGYEERFWSHEDSDIFCQMALLSEVHYLPLRLYKKRKHQNNLTGSSKANYGIFRNKWDLYFSSNSKVNDVVENSLKYYYTRHRPLRDIKVAFKALLEFITTQKKHSLKWSLQCFKSGLTDLVLHKNFKIKQMERSVLVGSKD